MSAASFELRVAEWFGYGRMPSDPIQPPVVLRRRFGPLVRRALELAWNSPDRGNAHIVVSSRHGEFDRTVGMLEALALGHETSPADFSLAVHNAPGGMIAIATGCKLPQTAIAAGPESLCHGLLEAAMLLLEKPEHPVLLIHYDAPLPGFYQAFNDPHDREELLVLCLRSDAPQRFRCTIEPAQADPSPFSASSSFAQLLAGEDAEIRFESGRASWHWSRCDA